MPNILIIGATSAIAEACSREYAARGDALFLTGRNSERLRTIANDLRVRGAGAVHTAQLDVVDDRAQDAVIAEVWRTFERVDIALIAHGTLPDQTRCAASPDYALAQFNVNASATIGLLVRMAARMSPQRVGTLAVISSVAGDRGRASNFLYGSAKAAISTYSSGLRQSLSMQGINVLTIKPGFVDTPMTDAFPKNALWASPARVAKSIVRAIDRRRSIVYAPWFWSVIMFAIKNVPEFLFRRVKL